MSATSIIPEGYTFVNPWTMITKKGWDKFQKLLEKMDNRNPNLFKMYICNDYFGYAQLDIIDVELKAIDETILDRDWDEAYVLLEALTTFFTFGQCTWPMVDDGDQIELADQVYGASLVTVMRALKREGRLNVENFPTLEYVLKQASKWGKDMPSPVSYRIVLQGIGKRLFENKPRETLALERARAEEWLKTLPEDDQKELRSMMQQEEAEAEPEKPWWDDDGPAFEDLKHSELNRWRIWERYKAHMVKYPSVPMLGPPIWDLNKWSKKDKAAYLFSSMR